jgi:thymidine kinase
MASVDDTSSARRDRTYHDNVRGTLNKIIEAEATKHGILDHGLQNYVVLTTEHPGGWTAQCVVCVTCPTLSKIYPSTTVCRTKELAMRQAELLALVLLTELDAAASVMEGEEDAKEPRAEPRDAPADESKDAGKVVLYLGCVNSGKTERLNQEIRRLRITKRRVVAIQWDDLYSGGSPTALSSSAGSAEPGILATCLADCDAAVAGAEVVVIDTGHMFGDLVCACERWARAGKLVLVAALPGDCMQTGYEQVAGLVPRADRIEYLQAVCFVCGKNASFSSQVGVGAYAPACRNCFAAHRDKVRDAAAQSRATCVEARAIHGRE